MDRKIFSVGMAVLSLSAAQVTVVGPTLAEALVLEEVIVSARKRSESLQDVPMAVTAFTDQVIREAEIYNAEDVAILTPSLSIAVNTQPFTAAFRIRGIGTSQTDVALEPSVGIFVDDVYLNRSGLGMADLTDIERIEVLHGPQGTLYGKNSNAGAVSIITTRPDLEAAEGSVQASVGAYDLRKVTAAFGSPLSETMAFRLAGTFHQRDGYFDNGAGADFNDADDWNVIAKFLYAPTESLSVLIKGSHVDRGSRCCAADAEQGESVNEALAERGLPLDRSDPFDFEVATDVDNDFSQETDELSMVIDFRRSFGDIKSITAWSETEGNVSYDPDRSELDVMSYVDGTSSGDFFSQELRLSAAAGEHLDYQVGLFYFESTTNAGDGEDFVFLGDDFLSQASQQPALASLLPPGIPFGVFAQPGDSLSAESVLETESVALFGQATWTLSDRWRITGGLRWTDEDKSADLLTVISSTAPLFALTGQSFLSSVSAPIDESFSRNSDNTDWLLNVRYDLLEDTMLFASVATGSKSGGFNTVNGTPEQREFDDESTISYELGVKSTLMNSRLRVNASLFRTEIEDYQFQQQLEIGIGTRVSNQAEVETSGLDMELQALPLPNLILTAGLLYMHDYEITAGPQRGADLPFVAEYNINASATLILPLAGGNGYLRADYSYMDDHVTGASSIVEARDIQDRRVVNAKLGWRNQRWDVSLWGKNLTDDEYSGLTAATFPPTAMNAYFLTPPLTYGATLRYEF